MCLRSLASKIRLRYSGLAVFSSRLFQILTGFLFTIAVTRNLTVHEFGIWQNIADMQGYFTLLAVVLPRWQIRYMARGIKGSGKTGVISNFIFSLPVTFIFLVMSPNFARAFETLAVYYVVASIQVVELYLKPAMEGLGQATKPQVIGYVQFLREIVKIVLGVVLIVILKLGIMGAIITVTLTYGFDIFYLSYYFRNFLKERLKFHLLRDWSKGSLLSLYGIIPVKLYSLDVLLLILIVGVEARAVYGAAYVIGSLITYAISLSIGLYPRLLSGGGRKDVETVLKTTYLFAIPMAAGVIAYSESFLTILNPVYISAKFILSLIAIQSLITCFSNIMNTIILGFEKVDVEGGFTFRNLLKSNFFLLPTIGYFFTAAYLPFLYLIFQRVSNNPLIGAQMLALTSTIFSAFRAVIYYRLSRKSVYYKIPYHLLKYAFSALVMAVILHILPIPTRIFTTFIGVALGAMIYFSLLAAIDHETRFTIYFTFTRISRKIFGSIKTRVEL